MAYAGIAMLLCVIAAMLLTGEPTWLLLIGVASIFAGAGVISGDLAPQIFMSAPLRIVGLLENDLLQALPLYVLIGALLNRLPIAEALFSSLSGGLRRTGAGRPLAALGLGGLLAPMNGSVGASVQMLATTVAPRLRASKLPEARTASIVATASTLGVVVPPSLVLILLGDAMLTAHSQALNTTGAGGQIINTQDLFRGALVPAGAIFVLALVITWWTCRGSAPLDSVQASPPISGRDRATAIAVLLIIVGLLGAVSLGYIYAVEAAATGLVLLLAYGTCTRTLTVVVLRETLRSAISVTGSLFSLLVGATMFTLVLRSMGTDRLLASWIAGLRGGDHVPLVAALVVLLLCAFVLDAFEMIFVVVPVLIPPVLVRVPDAVWVAVLTLLVLQLSFLLPPFGYAIQMVRNALKLRVPMRAMSRAIAPYLIAQLIVMAIVLAWPGVLWRSAASGEATVHPLSDDEAREQMQRQLALPPSE